jgi:hypothetical protein
LLRTLPVHICGYFLLTREQREKTGSRSCPLHEPGAFRNCRSLRSNPRTESKQSRTRVEAESKQSFNCSHPLMCRHEGDFLLMREEREKISARRLSCIRFNTGCGSDHTDHVSHPSRRAHPRHPPFQYIRFDGKTTLQLPYFIQEVTVTCKPQASWLTPFSGRSAGLPLISDSHLLQAKPLGSLH